jgi:hypothetical protein
MRKKSMRIILVIICLGILTGGCASSQKQQVGYFNSANHLWLDDLSFQNDKDKPFSDWEILDLHPNTFSNSSETFSDLQYDFMEILK